jgi:hypothetical protein
MGLFGCALSSNYRVKLKHTSIKCLRAAGCSSGAMVARYTRALSGELAVEEFQRSWGNL